MENPQNFGLFDINTIANYDPIICQHLDSKIGTALVRNKDSFHIDKEFEPSRQMSRCVVPRWPVGADCCWYWHRAMAGAAVVWRSSDE